METDKNIISFIQENKGNTEIIVEYGENQENSDCDEVMISIEDERGNVVKECSAVKIESQEIPEGATVIAQGE